MNKGTALITGASSGIGLEFATLLAKESHDLVLVARRKAQLNSLAKALTLLNPKISIEIITADLSKPNAANAIISQLKKKNIKITTLINSAGFGSNGRFDTLNLSKELQMIDVNVRALVELTGLLLPNMLKQKKGLILNVSSTAAFQPGPYMANYYASKAYVLHFTEALSYELRKSGVIVSALCPGPTQSEFFDVAGMQGIALTKNKFAPVSTAKEVAEIGWKKANYGKRVIIVGWTNRILALVGKLSPRFLVRIVSGRLNR